VDGEAVPDLHPVQTDGPRERGVAPDGEQRVAGERDVEAAQLLLELIHAAQTT
jgi:hypothetical protein